MSWVILPGDGSGKDRLARWWVDTSHTIDQGDHSGAGGITPLEWVAFIFVGNLHKHHLQDKNTCLPISQESVLRQAPLNEKVLAVFFTWVLFPATGEQEWHILGCCPVAKFREGMTIGDLLRTRRFNVTGLVPWQGSTSKSYWPRLCIKAPKREELDEDSGWVNMEKVMYRRDLMMAFWKHRRNATFVDTDGLEMLWQLHNGGQACGGGGAFFDLSSDKGREEEYVSYWTLAWICAHNPFLWARWAHWERTLFEYRVKKFFFKERHFALIVSANNLTQGDAAAAILVDDPGDRERELYARRVGTTTNDKKAPMPTLWLSVPVTQVGRSIAECPDYDIDQGRVIITHQEFIPWIWNRMELAAGALMKAVFEKSRKGSLLSSDQSNAGAVLGMGMAPIVSVLRVEEEEDAMLRLKRRAEMMTQEYGPGGMVHQLSLFDAGTPGALLELAKRRMPPCMARHIWKALVYKQHPKNEARLSLVKFLIEAQYEIPEAERVMYLLYEADTAFVRQNHHGQWNAAAFKKEYGGQVKQLHESIVVEKRIGAYGCASLTSDEKRDKSSGCPFAMTVGLEARAFLQWAEVKDIEDVMRKPHPQERCCKYYMDRHPDKPPVTVRHPNQFFRGSSYAPPQVAAAAAAAAAAAVTSDNSQMPMQPRVKREKIEIE